jgi:hypothetical protein
MQSARCPIGGDEDARPDQTRPWLAGQQAAVIA